VVHDTPGHNHEYLFPYSQPDKVRLGAPEADANVLIVGHMHLPMLLRCGITWIVNPGSVCKNGHRDLTTCAVLTLPDLNFTVMILKQQP